MMLDNQTILALAIAGVASYLLGSLNFAMLISRARKDDIRNYGSGNAGMTNILRTYGKKAAVATALGDFLKAIVAVTLSRWLFSLLGIHIDPGYFAGLMVLLGHIHPLYFGFRGGKGVMTSLAVILAVNPLVFLIIAGVFVPLTFITKIVSLGSVLGATAFPIVTCTINWIWGMPMLLDAVFSTIIGVVILYKHKDNIKRLLNGTENKFGAKK